MPIDDTELRHIERDLKTFHLNIEKECNEKLPDRFSIESIVHYEAQNTEVKVEKENKNRTQDITNSIIKPIYEVLGTWNLFKKDAYLRLESFDKELQNTRQENENQRSEERTLRGERLENIRKETNNEIEEIGSNIKNIEIKINDSPSSMEVNRRPIKYRGLSDFLNFFIPFLYMFSLLVIGSAEWFVNYPFISRVDVSLPFFAIALSLFIALTIAISSHYHGLYLKQFQYRRTHTEDNMTVNIITSLVTFFFALVLFLVIYIRLYVVTSVSITTSSIDNIEQFNLVLITLITNLVIWFIGVFVSFIYHPANPRIAELFKDIETLEAKKSNLESRKNKAIKLVEEEESKKSREIESAMRKIMKAGQKLKSIQAEIPNIENKITTLLLAKANENIRLYQELLQKELKSAKNPPVYNNGEDKFPASEYARDTKIYLEDSELKSKLQS